MKTRITVLLLALTMGLTTVSQAAFVVKKEARTEQTSTPANANENATTATASAEATTPAKKHSLRHSTSGKAEISKGLYILLAILGFGFLGMGLNDSFSGTDWLICLVLTLIFWLPGFIYALIKMKKYYK